MWYLNPDAVFGKTESLPDFLQLRKLLSCSNASVIEHKFLLTGSNVITVTMASYCRGILGAISKLDLGKGY